MEGGFLTQRPAKDAALSHAEAGANSEECSTGLIGWNLAAIIDNTMPPPRDPDEDDEGEDEEHEQDGADEPLFVREPDED